MRVLITTATGFIGTRMRQRLLAEGWHVVGATRSETTPLAYGSIRLVISDPADDSAL